MPIISFDRNPNASIERKLQSLKESTQRALDELQNELKNELQNSASAEPSDESNSQGGQDGKDGKDGFSPTVVVTEITGGHRVSITDVYGVKTFDVMDGADGKDGEDGQDGAGGTSYVVGDIIVTSTNENPASRYGGTWELFDKHLKRAYYDKNTSGLFTPGGNTTSYSIYATTHEHTVNIRVDAVSSTATSDTNKLLGTVDYSKLGFSSLTHTVYSVSGSDSTEAAMLTELMYSSGAVTVIDIFPKKDSGTIPASATLRGTFMGTINTEGINDAYCNKFFWKKTA